MPVENIEQKANRILVIGSIGHPSEVRSYSWEDVKKIPNIADYDVVILDMTTIAYDLLKSITSFKNLNTEKVNKLLISHGTLLIISPTRFNTEERKDILVPNYPWFGGKLMFKEESGERIDFIDEKFNNYFRFVKNWEFIISFPDVIPIAKNRSNDTLAARFKTHNCYILPKPTEITTKEGIDILLEDLFDIKTSGYPEPDWARPIKVPGIDKIEKDIEKFECKKKEMDDKIKNLEEKKKELTKFKKLLFSESYELEKIVRATFREFKANVHDPIEQGKDDGRVITKYGKGVLEIKKKSKSASKKDVRQLDEWVGNCLAEDEEHKGILVINHYGDSPLEEREEPFPDNVEKYAKKVRKQPFCLLTTLQLFDAFCAFKEQKLKADDILKRIFKANGECKLLDNSSVNEEKNG